MGSRARVLCGLAVMASISCTSPPAFLSAAHPYDFRAKDFIEKEIQTLDSDLKGCYQQKDSVEAKRCRNDVVGRTRSLIDDLFRKFASELYGRTAATKTGIESGSATLSAAAAITTPPSAASILSALSASLTAFGTSAGKNFLGEKTTDLLLGQMNADRRLVGARIQLGLNLEVDKYPLATAMADLSEYALTMSVSNALQSLTKASVAEEREKDDKTAKLQQGALNVAPVPQPPASPVQRR